MANEKNEPPKAAERGDTPTKEIATESGGLKQPAPAGADAPSPAPAPRAPVTSPVGTAGPGVPAKPPATTPAKLAPAPKAPVKPEPWSDPLLDELQKKFPGAICEAVIFRKMPSLNVAKEQLVSVCEYLRGEAGGAYTLLTDETAVDFPKREKRFDIIYHLYSFEQNTRLRLRVQVGVGEQIPSVTGVWPTANWLEREIYDMFGVEYEGHPNLKRILMPEEWVGHPLCKDYDILKQDQAWVKANLGIESGQ